jgi:hypothetical protein
MKNGVLEVLFPLTEVHNHKNKFPERRYIAAKRARKAKQERRHQSRLNSSCSITKKKKISCRSEFIAREAQKRGTSMPAERFIKSTGMVNFVKPTHDPAFQILSQNRILHSWKEIAAYMTLGVRTIQRYEDRFHLPIHRPGGKQHRSAVLALSDEIDDWLRNTPTQYMLQIDGFPRRSRAPQTKEKAIFEFRY